MSASHVSRSRQYGRRVRSALGTGWPVTIGLLGLLAGLLMLGASVFLAPQTGASAALVEPPKEPPAVRLRIGAAGGDEALFSAPLYETHLDDVAFIFALAAEHGVSLGSVAYGTEVQPSLPLLVRTLDVRLAEDYSRVKPFVADLLARRPFLYLQEIRIDRGSGEAPKAQFILKLALVYRVGATATPLSDPTAIARSTGSPQP